MAMKNNDEHESQEQSDIDRFFAADANDDASAQRAPDDAYSAPDEPSDSSVIEDADNHAQSAAGDDAHGSSVQEALADNGNTEFVYTEQKQRGMSSVLALGLILAVGGGGLYFMYGKAGPAGARAASIDPSQEDVRRTVDSFLEGGQTRVQTLEAALRDTQKVVDQFRDYPSMDQVPLSDLKTNPFRLREPTPEAQTPDNSADIAAALKRKHDQERAAALDAVSGLRLESILSAGTRKACTIDGTVCHEGQVVEGFLVDRIDPQDVILRQGKFRFEVQLQH